VSQPLPPEPNPANEEPTAWDAANPDDPHRSQRRPAQPTSASEPEGVAAADDIDAQAPGLYVDSATGPVPEPNEPA